MDPEIRMRLTEGLRIAEVRERDALSALKNSGWLDLGVILLVLTTLVGTIVTAIAVNTDTPAALIVAVPGLLFGLYCMRRHVELDAAVDRARLESSRARIALGVFTHDAGDSAGESGAHHG